MTAISVKDVTKAYRNGTQALCGISITVKKGEIFSLLGPNGAGKSTLVNILTTYLRPTSGEVIMLDKDICRNAAAIRRQIACVAQHTSIDMHLSLMENMLFQSRLYRIPKSEAQARIRNLIESFDLNAYMKYPVASYSGGIKRRLDIALCMISNPRILFMDEPTVGMDITSRRAMWQMIEKIKSNFGSTVFLTTHYLEEADRLSDTICIMKDGKEIIQGTPDTLRTCMHRDMLEISFASGKDAGNCFSMLQAVFALDASDLRQDKIIIKSNGNSKDLNQINRWLLEHDVNFRSIGIVQPTLEDICINLLSTGKKETI